MTQPKPAEPWAGAPSAEPTQRVARPPIPGRAVRADVAAGNLATPPVRHDDPTVTLSTSAARPPHRTLEFGTPVAVNVTVAARERTRRRFRSRTWILGLSLVLLVLGVVLLIMMLRGATIDGTADLIGAGLPAGAGPVPSWTT